MKPSVETLKNLIRLVQELVISEKTILLYLYYCMYGKTSPTRDEIKRYTGLGLKTIQKHDKVLELMTAIKREPLKGRSRRTAVTVFAVKPTPPSSLPPIRAILNIPTQKEQAHRILAGEDAQGNNGARTKKDRGVGRFSVMDIAGDEDWQKAKVSLEKYFKKFEIEPTVLTTKNRFAKLVELVIDETLDFDGYCKWYYREKYPDKGFNFGLFLYPNMVEEYRDAEEREGKYLKTSSRLVSSESHKQSVKETKEFFKKIGIMEDGK